MVQVFYIFRVRIDEIGTIRLVVIFDQLRYCDLLPDEYEPTGQATSDCISIDVRVGVAQAVAIT